MSSKLKQSILQNAQKTYGSFHLKARTGIKPIEWVGTQRTAFTHRKNQRRIKAIIEKEKVNFEMRKEQRLKLKKENAEK